MAILELPTDKDALVKALDSEIGRADLECNVQKAGWKIVDHYLAGIRNFNIVDPTAGTLEIAFENWDGNMTLRYEQILQDYSTEVGRILKMNNEPTATRAGESLDALRKGAIAHATLNTLIQPLGLDRLKSEAVRMLVKYGTVGIEHYESMDPKFPDAVSIVHPRELRGIPAWVDGSCNLRAIVRKRHVPLDWIKKRINLLGKNLPTDTAKLRAVPVSWGASTPGEAKNDYGATTSTMSSATAAVTHQQSQYSFPSDKQKAKREPTDSKPTETGRLYVCLEEVYVLDTDPRYMCRYIVKIGEAIPIDENYERPGHKMVCPLQIARYTDTGRFFGRGYVGPQIPFNDVIERMLGNFFQNVIDMDIYGTVLIPDTWNVDLEKFKAGRRPRIDTYSPDLSAPQHQQIVISPVTSGTMPSQAAQVGLQIMDKLSGHGSMFQGEASKRMDSASGHGFLFDVANIRLSMPVNSFADAWVGIYERMLQIAKARIDRGEAGPFQLAVIDEAMAGVVIGPDGTLELEANPLPHPWEVRIDIKDRQPKDMFARKQELKELLQMQLVSPTQFWLTTYDEKLDIPGQPRDLIESYRKAVWQTVILFGNGKEPGQITLSENAGNPEVTLMVVQRFMNKIEFSLAEQAVRETFEQWKIALEQMMGRGFPDGLMPPDQAAQMQKQGAFNQPSPPGM